MDNEKLKYQYNALKWIFEHQLLDDPQCMNHLAMNVFDVSKSIKDVEFLLARDHQQLLVYVELSWFGRNFRKKSIFEETEYRLSQMLPSFKMRVTNDPQIFKMALEKVKKALTGGSREASTKSADSPSTGGVPSGSSASGAQAPAENGSQPAVAQANPQKQSEAGQELRSEAVPGDSSKERKV
jgi:hypothetical protein